MKETVKVLAESTLTSKVQLTLPQVIRRLLGVRSGDSLRWKLNDEGQVIVEPSRSKTLADVRAAVAAAGPVPDPGSPVSTHDMKEGIAAEMRRKHARG